MQLTIWIRPDLFKVITYQFLYPPDENGKIFMVMFHWSICDQRWFCERLSANPVHIVRQYLRRATKVVRNGNDSHSA